MAKSKPSHNVASPYPSITSSPQRKSKHVSTNSSQNTISRLALSESPLRNKPNWATLYPTQPKTNPTILHYETNPITSHNNPPDPQTTTLGNPARHSPILPLFSLTKINTLFIVLSVRFDSDCPQATRIGKEEAFHGVF